MKKIILFITFYLLISGYLESQNLYWERAYDSKTEYREELHDLKLDSLGNVYITGQSGGNGTAYDFVSIKYNSAGVMQWLARFDNSASTYNLDIANSLAIDDQGNVFVTGETINRHLGGGIYDYDLVTIKYNRFGVQQWVAVHDSSGSDGAVSVATDKNGYIYVIGTESYSGNMATIKYDQNGNVIWVARTPGRAVKIIIDSENNIISACSYSTKLKVVKYTQNGLKIWEDTVGFTDIYNAYVQDITVDNQNNVILIGTTYNGTIACTAIKWNKDGQRLWLINGAIYYFYNSIITDNSQNIYIAGKIDLFCYTLKVNPQGTIIWERFYDYVGNSGTGVSISVDNNSNVYVADDSWGPSALCSDYNLIKYNNNGTELWVKRFNGPASGCDHVSKVVVDNSNNIILGGNVSGIGSLLDYGTVKYGPNGNLLWSDIYKGPSSDEFGNSVQIDDSGNVYVSGYGWGNESSLDYLTIKYDATGILQWPNRYNGISNDTDISTSSVLDLNDRIYITGGSKNTSSGFDYLTVRYNGNGTQDVELRYNGPGNGNDIANLVLNDHLNNVYVTGKSIGAGTDFDYATIKYNQNGTVQWVSRYNGNGNEVDEATSMTIDDVGNIYVTGKSIGTGTNYDYLTIKYNSSGIQQWTARYNGESNDADEASSIVLDNSGNVYVTGKSIGMSTNYDCTTVKYNSNGIQQWAVRYNGSSNGFDEGRIIKLDGSGNIYVSGNTQNINSDWDFLTVKYNTFGINQWTKTYNGQFNGNDIVNSMCIGTSGSIFVAGSIQKNQSGSNIGVIKYSTNGLVENVRNIDVGPTSDAKSINTDNFENVYISGSSLDSIWYLNNPITGSNMYVAKLTSELLSTEIMSSTISKNFHLSQNYPNPFNPQTKIKFDVPKASFTKLIIYDLLGREVATLVNDELKPGTYEADWDASNFSSGVYFYRIITNEFTESKKMLMVK